MHTGPSHPSLSQRTSVNRPGQFTEYGLTFRYPATWKLYPLLGEATSFWNLYAYLSSAPVYPCSVRAAAGYSPAAMTPRHGVVMMWTT